MDSLLSMSFERHIFVGNLAGHTNILMTLVLSKGEISTKGIIRDRISSIAGAMTH
jgi:hypothetical protein